MLSQTQLTKAIGYAASAGDMDFVAELTNELNTVYLNPAPEKKKRSANNTTGYCQLDAETGKLIAKFQTVREANEALGKKPESSNISDACRSYRTGHSNRAYGFAWLYGSDYDALQK